MGTGGSFPGRDDDHPPPSSVEVRNEHSYTSTPTTSLHGVNRCNFYFHKPLLPKLRIERTPWKLSKYGSEQYYVIIKCMYCSYIFRIITFLSRPYRFTLTAFHSQQCWQNRQRAIRWKFTLHPNGATHITFQPGVTCGTARFLCTLTSHLLDMTSDLSTVLQQ